MTSLFSTTDWVIIVLFFVITMAIGLWTSRLQSDKSEDFFLGGRNMSWWLLGISMVATTFSADTPNLVTDIVRNNGVAGNWVWWAFLLTGMLTVFVYAKMWRRSGIGTDIEFYELRYSGKMASFLRGFRALYLGVFFNVMIMATVLLAGVKISAVMLGISPMTTVLLVGCITVIYSAIGGFKGVIYTDFFQFVLAMGAMVWAAIYIVGLPEIGGLQSLLSHPNVQDKLNFLPSLDDKNIFIPLLLMPLAVQWWSVWYPGAEPGGGGYIAQRMLSAKNEKNAVYATLLFNAAHYALRPWPWILIALASLVIFPDLASLQKAFPAVNPQFVKDDLAFSAMLTYLPNGLLGLILAALIAALMSTISTHLNWGSSYIVNDYYKRFINPTATEQRLVFVGKVSTVVLMVMAAIAALWLESALSAFNILLQIGAGTGLLFILRWFWWRINAVSELTAMSVSFIIAVFLELVVKDALLDYEKMLLSVGITTIAWITATFMSQPTDKNTLINFYKLIKPHSAGWKSVINEGIENRQLTPADITQGKLPIQILMMFFGCICVYALLFGFGYLIYGMNNWAMFMLFIAGCAAYSIKILWSSVENA